MRDARIGRRAALGMLGAAVAGGATAGAVLRRQAAAGATVTVVPGEAVGTIRPEAHGHFAEHIGGVIYDGIWVGPDSKIPNTRGIRDALVARVRRLGRTVVRWPGGCFADAYHWRDGIGPRARRPRRFGRWREETEPNGFGTHEFIDFCRQAGLAPYFAANVGTGTPEEFQSWVEYCNAPAGRTTLADDRAANGDPTPFGVRHWGVGNESWGCGGKYTPEDYCREVRRFTEWVPEYGVPLDLIAAGPDGNNLDWTRRFFRKWADGPRAPIKGWAPHYYCGTTGHALNFSADQWYEMLAKALRMEPLLVDQWGALAEFDPEHKIKLVVDEWGAWHPPGTEINPRHQFEQMGCLRDALVAGLTLDTFHRHADKVAMGCVAQLVNNLHSLFLADGDRFVCTPTYHVFALYAPHQGATSVRIDVQAEDVPFSKGRVPRVSGSASVARDRLVVTLVHTHASEPVEVDLVVRGAKAEGLLGSTLTHERLNAHNTFDRPNEVRPAAGPFEARGGSIRLVLKPASVNRLDLKLGGG